MINKKLVHFDRLKGKIALLFIAVFSISLVYTYQQDDYGHLFNASILEDPKPFDGTVYPADKVPDWTHWGGDNHVNSYSSISNSDLMDMPEYDPQMLLFPDNQLIWGKSEHDYIRNAKLTYSVVYLGNYMLDHKENAGSHLAVDIRMPTGTPLRSIANGEVVKVSSGSGFGNHVVISHPNVPDPEHPGQITTLYSGYAHMDSVSVKEGEIVDKGDFIGKSGNTGVSTTPHLHFQIDRDEAPWHLYWPFTSQEAAAADLGFFDAVNVGLGSEKAKLYTVHPLDFVQRHLSGEALLSEPLDVEEISESEVEIIEPDVEVVSESELKDNVILSGDSKDNKVEFGQVIEVQTDLDFAVEVAQPEVVQHFSPSGIDTSLFSFDFIGDSFGLMGQNINFRAIMNPVDFGRMEEGDVVEVLIAGDGKVSDARLSKSDFSSSGIAKINVTSQQKGRVLLSLGKSSHEFYFIDKVMPTANLKLDTDSQFRPGVPQEIEILALDEEGLRTPATNFPGVIELSTKQGAATFEPQNFKASDFKDGKAMVTMIPQGNESIVVRAQSGAISGDSSRISMNETPFFADVSLNHANYKAIKFLEDAGVISGYPDGTFKPELPVKRVEALKMLMLAFEVDSGGRQVKLPFNDTDESSWYASTLATALDRSIVRGYEDGSFKPEKVVNKAEYLKMLYVTNSIEPKLPLMEDPYSDVPRNSWYAGYAHLTNRQNLIDVVNDQLNAESGMTRGDVAETIYRLMQIMQNDLVSYQPLT